MAEVPYIPMILGTVREGRRSLAVARFLDSRLALRKDLTYRFYDAKDLPFGNLVLREWEMKERPEWMAAFVDDMARADGFILVTPEYNGGVPGALKNLLDHLLKQWGNKPFGLVGCGGGGGGRRCLFALQGIITALNAVTLPTPLVVPEVEKQWGEDGPIQGREEWEKRADRFIANMVRYSLAMRAVRQGTRD